jgi:Na+/proline symporter
MAFQLLYHLIIKDIMNSFGLLLILVLYLSILFLYWWLKSHSKWTNNPLFLFASGLLLLGPISSIGVAAESGLNYLPIYLGPILIIPTWMIILKRIINFE